MIAAAPLILIVTTTLIFGIQCANPTHHPPHPRQGAQWLTYVSASETERAMAPRLHCATRCKRTLNQFKNAGVELTAEQKAMRFAEFEGTANYLTKRGLVDTYKGADVMTPEEFEALQQDDKPATTAATIPTLIPAPVPSAPLLHLRPYACCGAGLLDPAMARLWLMQQNERETAVQLLQKRVDGGAAAGAVRRISASQGPDISHLHPGCHGVKRKWLSVGA